MTFCLWTYLSNSCFIYQKTPAAGTAHLEFLRPFIQNYLVSYGKSAKIPRGQCFVVIREWKTEYPRQPEMIKFPTLLKMLKKEQDVLFVINQVLSINVLNAMSMCTWNASQPFTTVNKMKLTFLIVFLKTFIHVSFKFFQ